jgi:hypothetical protein
MIDAARSDSEVSVRSMGLHVTMMIMIYPRTSYELSQTVLELAVFCIGRTKGARTA